MRILIIALILGGCALKKPKPEIKVVEKKVYVQQPFAQKILKCIKHVANNIGATALDAKDICLDIYKR